MKVIPLRKRGTQYTCNVYLVLGTWNRIEDVNTLVDVGPDDFILNEIPEIPTGVGKVPVQQIVLTHNHFDHAAGMERVRKCTVRRSADFRRCGGWTGCSGTVNG
jgi:glyoxylase-like metal-dependent hydrolase (beta-lactamase superfamily II)